MRRSVLYVVCLLSFRLPLNAAGFYVSPSGTAQGEGTFSSPWPLQYALTNNAVTNGDYLWIRGGNYQGLFTTTIKSTASNAPVIVRNYNQERAVVDGQLWVGSSSTNVWFWGLEFIDSDKTNRSHPFSVITGGGLGTKFINCLIHDCCIGLSSGESSGMQEAYGNVMWNCGAMATSLEHSFYWQNAKDEAKTIECNLSGYSSGFGLQFYGSAGHLQNMNILSNGFWCSSDKSEILTGGSMPMTNVVVRGNHVFNSGGRGVQIGYTGNTNNDTETVSDNYIYAAYAILISDKFSALTVTNNTVSDAYAACIKGPADAGTADWDYNSYYGEGGSPWTGYFWFSNSVWYGWDTWRSTSGYDSHSTYISNIYAPNLVTVIPNKYEPKRANILVWNWTGMASTNADVSAVLQPGDHYELRYAQNWFAGPVASGTYDGSGVTIPLTNLPSPAARLYDSAWTYRINTNLSAFVLLGANTNSIEPATNLHLIPGN